MIRMGACVLALMLLTGGTVAAQRTLVIEQFEATIDVSASGSIVVEETIHPRFTGSWNGIYRTIPVQYRTPHGLSYTLRLAVESVTDGAGTPLRYETSRHGRDQRIQIWVPGAQDATRVVRLRYRVPNALRFFDAHDELFWNVTGDEWEVPIEAAAAYVRLPDGVSGVRATAFRGVYGSTEPASVSIEERGVRIRAARGLGFREGLTLVVGWNPGVVHRPSVVERTASLLTSNLPLGLPPLVFFAMFRWWRARGRDPELRAIVAHYEPPDQMTPAEVGTLVDGKPDMRDITATIVDLAVRGYLHIAEREDSALFGLFSKTDYLFTLKRPSDQWDDLKRHERFLLESMFRHRATSVRLSDLKNQFYKHLPGLRDRLYDGLVTHRLYTRRPDRVRMWFMVGGGVVGAVVAAAGATLLTTFGAQPLAGIVGGVSSGLIIIAFGWFMPARTTRGTRELEKVLGFQEFLSRVEGDRLARVVKTPEMFERFLPYAMALSVEESWARAFDDIYWEPPRWYTGTSGGSGFRTGRFTSNLGRLGTQVATVLSSAPRSSGGSGFGGGGSSGGGFGGGGGGGF